MIYKIEVIVERPIEKTLILFQDTTFMKKWQTGFEELIVLEGVAGEVGSKNKLIYMNRGKQSEIIETILLKDLPNRFDFLYEAKGVQNWAKNSFEDLNGKTKWIAEHEFQFTGFMKALALFPKMFMKQTTADMVAFKKHAEET